MIVVVSDKIRHGYDNQPSIIYITV